VFLCGYSSTTERKKTDNPKIQKRNTHSVVLTTTPNTIMLKETREKRKTAEKNGKARHIDKKENEQFVSSIEKGNLSLKFSFRKFFRIGDRVGEYLL
jgi:hypothetical protein